MNAPDSGIPLCVDLDGTLIDGDLLWLTLGRALRRAPWIVVLLPLWLWRGRAVLKHELARRATLDAAALPYRADVLAWLRAERAQGRRIVLATAADRLPAEAVARHLNLFDTVLASDPTVNLKSTAKLEAIRAGCGEAFDYAGDSRADLPLWRAAREAILVGAPPWVEHAARASARVGRTFPPTPASTLRWTGAGIGALGAALLALLVTLDVLAPGGRGFLVVTPKNIDSLCYFANAHSLLFDQDFDLRNQFAVLIPHDAPLGPRSLRWVRVSEQTGLPGSPYAIGYSLLGIPFLAAGTVVDWLTGNAADGYGPWAERFFAAANLVFLTLGLWAAHLWLARVALRWRKGSEWSVAAGAALSAAALVPATALGYYAFTVMSHTASFLAASLFLLAWWRGKDSERTSDWLWIGAAAGLMTLCRWQNALYLAVVLVYELGAVRRMGRRAWWTSRSAGAAACLLALIPQLAQWRTLYGSWLTVPQGEGFLVWPPGFALHVLFSSQNGLFFTTPATLAGAAGLVWGLRRDTRLFAALLTAAALQVGLLGSMPENWHGMIFAMRNLINMLPFIALGWLFLMLHTGRRGRAAVAAWVAAGAVFTLLSAVQWRYEFVPRAARLTFEEAFTSKLRLPSEYRRWRAMQQATTADALERVRQRHGGNAVLWRKLERTYTAEGREQESAAAGRWLAGRQQRLLF